MKTSEIAIRHGLLNLEKTTKAMEKLSYKLSTGKDVSSSKDDPTAWAKARKSRYAANNLQAINDSLNSVAMNVRTVELTMDSVSDIIDQMDALLKETVGTYPESSGETEQRAKLISNFNHLREQIDQMTETQKDWGAMKLMANPEKFSEAGDWSVLVNENGVTMVIHSQEIHTGKTGLDIPELSETATDEEINAAISNLQTASDKLFKKQQALGIDTMGISFSQNFNDDLTTNHVTYAELLENADTNEVTAEIKSLELRQALATEALSSLLDSQSLLSNLWR